MNDKDYKIRAAAKAVDILAGVYAEAGKGVKAQSVRIGIAQAVLCIHESVGDGIKEKLSPKALEQFYSITEKIKKPRAGKYPWSDLKKAGDRFTYKPEISEGENAKKVRFSIACGAHRIFGPGVISVRIVPSGSILVIRKK